MQRQRDELSYLWMTWNYVYAGDPGGGDNDLCLEAYFSRTDKEASICTQTFALGLFVLGTGECFKLS